MLRSGGTIAADVTTQGTRRQSFACLDCGAISDQRRCPEHRQKHHKSSLVNGSTRRWRKTRAFVLGRDPVCTLKLRCNGAPSVIADHIIDRVDGGTDLPTNLRGVCKDCHDYRHSREGAASVSRQPVNPTPVTLA